MKVTSNLYMTLFNLDINLHVFVSQYHHEHFYLRDIRFRPTHDFVHFGYEHSLTSNTVSLLKTITHPQTKKKA